MTKEFAYYPGCASCSTGRAYELSSQYMTKQIGLELKEITDWCCCGASAAHTINHDLGLALPARNLAISQDEYPGLDVLATCAACYARLKNTQHYVNQSEENRAHIEYLIEREYRGEENVYSLLQAIVDNEDLKEAMVAALTKSLNGLKVACYYGCMLVRPVEVTQFDNEENPQSMEELLRLAGAEPVDWAFKTECCGASLQVTQPETGKNMVEIILRNAKENGAEVIATACPLCQLNLDMRENEVNRSLHKDYEFPVYYFTELLSMCMGATPNEIGIDKHYIPAVASAENAVAEREPEPEPDPEAEAEAKEIARAEARAKAQAKREAREAAKAAEAAETEAADAADVEAVVAEAEAVIAEAGAAEAPAEAEAESRDDRPRSSAPDSDDNTNQVDDQGRSSLQEPQVAEEGDAS